MISPLQNDCHYCELQVTGVWYTMELAGVADEKCQMSLKYLKIKSQLTCTLSLLVFSVSSCAPSSGPGSTRDAVVYARQRITELAEPRIRTDGDQFVIECLELKNIKSGCNVAGRKVIAWVKYDFRKYQTLPFLTHAEASAAATAMEGLPGEPVSAKWTTRLERFQYSGGKWTFEDQR
jgi:hypothetical protein